MSGEIEEKATAAVAAVCASVPQQKAMASAVVRIGCSALHKLADAEVVYLLLVELTSRYQRQIPRKHHLYRRPR